MMRMDGCALFLLVIICFYLSAVGVANTLLVVSLMRPSTEEVKQATCQCDNTLNSIRHSPSCSVGTDGD